jgi:diguanylate cyclase (GGDEF)-like protein
MEAASLRDVELSRDGAISPRDRRSDADRGAGTPGWRRTRWRDALLRPSWWQLRSEGLGDSGDVGLRNAVPRERAVLFFGFVALGALGALAATAPAVVRAIEQLGAWGGAGWMIAGLAVLVDLAPFRAPGRGAMATVFPSITFTFALLVGWGLGPAVAVQIVAVMVSSVRLRHAAWRALFNASQYALCFAAADAVLRLSRVPRLWPDGQLGVTAVLAILVAAGVWFAVNDVLMSTAVWLRFDGGWTRILASTFRQEALSTLALLALGPVAVAAANVSTALVPLMVIPLFTVNELARYSERERRQTARDELTGLPNRRALFRQMRSQARAYAERRSRTPADRRRMALVVLDIDQFRHVNDALGHAVGDRLLGAVAARLTEAIGSDGFVARLGGDEFAVLAPRLVDPSAASVLAERIADALGEPVTLDGLPLDVNAAIGIAIYPDHGTDQTMLLRHAEVAMYDAKQRAATYAVYSPESDQSSPERLELLADLRRALDVARPDEIQLFYQPQIDLSSGDVVGVEALLRWHHPERGVVSPEHLIKITEHTAVMRRLTARVLEEAIGQLAKWRAQGLVLRASVNVSVRDLHRPELVDQLAAMLADRGVAPNQLQLEITEGALMADPRRVLVTLHKLDTLGVALSLDDFGTGYSSLQHLRRLPLAEVKIDRSFVLGMTTDPDDAAVVGSIIDLARALGLRVVAEGVEDDQTRRMLLNGGCEVAQGWFYGRPMPPDALVAWLARYRPTPHLDGE